MLIETRVVILMSDKVCSVCIEALDEKKGNIDTVIPCGHSFHSTCLGRWLLKEKDTCPLCRGPVRSMTRLEKKVVKANVIPPALKEIEKVKKSLQKLRERIAKENAEKSLLAEKYYKGMAKLKSKFDCLKKWVDVNEKRLQELEKNE